jgi:predicted Ser/Thr protein kinase
MHAHPLFRPLAAATALVVACAALVFGFLPGLGASVEGLPLALVQRAANTPIAREVLWVANDSGVVEPGPLRSLAARALTTAAQGGARAIALAIPLGDASDSSDLTRVRSFLENADATPDTSMRARLKAWEDELDHDGELERAIRAAGNVALLGAAGAPPLERFATAARATGTEPSAAVDRDGVTRRERLYLAEAAGAAPSLSFATLLVAHGEARSDAPLTRPSLVALAERERAGRSTGWIPHYGERAPAADGTPRIGLADLAAGRIAASTLAQRILVIGDGVGTLTVPTGAGLPAGEATAQRIASLIADDYATVVPFARLVMALALLAGIVWAGLIAPRLEGRTRWVVTLLLALGLIALELGLLAGAKIWVPLCTAALLLPVATLVAWLAPEPRQAPAARPEPIVPVPPPAKPRPMDARAIATTPLYQAPQQATPPTSLRQLSEQLDVRREEPTPSEVADLLLGRSKRPAQPRLGRYELERELGRGAMGTVYLGRDPRINRVVAVKAIPLIDEFSDNDLDDAKSRFFREAEMAGRLHHAGIVTVYDAGEDNGIAWIAMEFLQGETLNQYTAPDKLLPPATVLEVVARIADALDYAHGEDVVHRDIKPANVVLDRAARTIKITDFGIARLTNTSATRSGIVLGTPSFMAPEQLEGRNVTGRSDLFALGVTLFQLLAGQLPFRADSMTGLMYKIANAPHPPLKTIRPDLPPCVSAIVDRALKKDPAERYPTAGEMARALRACARLLSA